MLEPGYNPIQTQVMEGMAALLRTYELPREEAEFRRGLTALLDAAGEAGLERDELLRGMLAFFDGLPQPGYAMARNVGMDVIEYWYYGAIDEEEVENLIEYYLQQTETVHNAAEQLLENTRDLEESISVSLSSRRYEVSKLELTLSIATFAAALGARGGGKAGRFQGKLAAALAPNAPELDAAEAACREALKNAAEATPESA